MITNTFVDTKVPEDKVPSVEETTTDKPMTTPPVIKEVPAETVSKDDIKHPIKVLAKNNTKAKAVVKPVSKVNENVLPKTGIENVALVYLGVILLALTSLFTITKLKRLKS